MHAIMISISAKLNLSSKICQDIHAHCFRQFGKNERVNFGANTKSEIWLNAQVRSNKTYE